jgi:hypothetical protein
MEDRTYLDTGDGIASSIIRGVGGRSLGRGNAHTILIFLANEDAGQIPKLGYVECFEDLTLIAGTVTVKGEGCDVGFTRILLSEGKTSSKRDLSTDNPVPSEERRGGDVHRSALSV